MSSGFMLLQYTLWILELFSCIIKIQENKLNNDFFILKRISRHKMHLSSIKAA